MLGYDFDYNDNDEVNVDYDRFDVYKNNYAKTRTSTSGTDEFFEDRNYNDYKGAAVRKFMENQDSTFQFDRMKEQFGNDDHYKAGDSTKLNLYDINRLE